jgi:formamidopyrimidine-DNA glycosylase
MPEGPEVRTVSDKLHPILLNKVITSSYLGPRAKTVGFFNLKCPTIIINVRSYGKKIIIDIDTGHLIIISLGMTGRLQYSSGDHSHVHFNLATVEINGSLRILRNHFQLFFDDYRYMGGVDIIPISGIQLYFKDIGPDLLQSSLDPITWIPLNLWISIYTQNKLHKRAICDVLVDQSLISSIGWYLMTDILYYSGVHPQRTVNSITYNEWDTIRISAHKIIKLSYSYGGFTIKSFINPDGQKGLYPAAVYGKSHDPVGNIVVKSKWKGRTLHYVPQIQK